MGKEVQKVVGDKSPGTCSPQAEPLPNITTALHSSECHLAPLPGNFPGAVPLEWEVEEGQMTTTLHGCRY